MSANQVNHFGEVPYSALTSLARRIDGNAGNGRPLSDLFASFGNDAADRASLTLMSGLTKGPLAAAADLTDVLGASRSHALTIARTELLGAYRDAQIQNYRANSDVVGEWMWSADKASACIACLDMDGQTFPLDEDLVSHPMCKCSPLPVTKGWDAILGPLGIDTSDIEDTSITAHYETGQDWLERQSAATQISVLGPAKYNAWQSGDVSLSDFVGTRNDGAWGQPIYEKSLKELGLNARDYLPSTARRPGLGAQGPEAVAGAREAVPPASAEPIKVALPGGGYTWIVPGDEHQFDAGGNLDLAKRAAGWQGIGEQMQGLRGEASSVESAAAEGASAALSPEDTALTDAQKSLDDLHAQYLDAQSAYKQLDRFAEGQADTYQRYADLRDQLERQQYEVEKAQAALDRANGGRGAIIHIQNTLGDPLDTTEFDKAVRNLFGRDLTRDELAGLIGAPPGSYVRIDPYARSDAPTMSSLGFGMHGPGWSPFDHRQFHSEYDADRLLSFNDRGQFLIMNNTNFMVSEEFEGQGLGVRIFVDEADNLNKLGVRWIDTHAAGSGSWGDPEFESSANGYYTWPRFGYTGHIPETSMEALQEQVANGDVPAAWGKYSTIQQLMRTPEGRQWWKDFGSETDLRFDLRDGSLSQRILQGYLNSKGLDPSSTDYWSVFDVIRKQPS